MTKIQIRIVIFSVVSALVLAAVYMYWTSTPLFAFQEAALAAKDHDLDKFKKYVDSERLVDSAMNDLLIDPIEKMPGLSEMGRRVAVAAIGLSVGPAESALIRQIESHVSGGRRFSALPLRSAVAAQPEVVRPGCSSEPLPSRFIFSESTAIPNCEERSRESTAIPCWQECTLAMSEKTSPYTFVSYSNSGELGNVLSVTRQEVASEFDKLRKIAYDRMQNYALNHQQGIVGRLFILAKDPRQANVSGLLAEYGLVPENFRGLAYCDTTDDGTGENCKTGFKFMSPKVNHNVILEVELSKRTGNWRVIRLSNLERLIEELDPSYASDFQSLIRTSVQGINSKSVQSEVSALTKRITGSDAFKDLLHKLNAKPGPPNYLRRL